MTPEDVKRLEAIQSTVLTDGWKILITDVQQKLDGIKEEFTNLNVSLEMLRFGQGRIQVYRELMALSAIVDNALQLAKEDEEDEAANG